MSHEAQLDLPSFQWRPDVEWVGTDSQVRGFYKGQLTHSHNRVLALHFYTSLYTSTLQGIHLCLLLGAASS